MAKPRPFYRQEYVRCGRDCDHGDGHGPYWYKYERDKPGGRLRKTYIGKKLPARAVRARELGKAG